MKNMYSGADNFNRTTITQTTINKNSFNRNKKITFVKQLFLFFILIGILAVVLHSISVAGKSISFAVRYNITDQQNLSGRQNFAYQQNLSDRHNTSKYYTSVTIRPGDTLWSIAEEYMPEDDTDTKKYIEEIMELNHLHSFKIHSGGSLVVPYY